MSVKERILQTCKMTFSGNTEMLKNANTYFESLFAEQTFGISALDILVSNETLPLKQIVSINFKRYFKLVYGSLNDVDKTAYKELLLKIIIQTPVLVQKQITEVFSYIIELEFPKGCQDLLKNLITFFHSQEILHNENSFKGVMMVINTIIKAKRFKTELYPFMIEFVNQIFSMYLTVFTTAVSSKMFTYTKPLLKAFKYLLYTKIPPFFNQQNTTQFYQAALTLLAMPFEFNQNSEKHPQLSSVINLIRGTTSIISQYTSKNNRKQSPTLTFFVENIACDFLKVMLSQMRDGLPKVLYYYMFVLMSYSVKTAKLSNVIQSVFPALLDQIIVKKLMITDAQMNLMMTEPATYLSELQDEEIGAVDAWYGALSLILNIKMYRPKNYLPLFLNPLLAVVPTTPEMLNKDEKLIDCACFILSKIVSSFTISQDYAKYVPALLSTTVPLLLKSGKVLLIRRGCDLFESLFVVLNYKKNVPLPQEVLNVVQLVFSLLTSNNLIVKVSAGSTLGLFVSYDCLRESFRPILTPMFDVLMQTAHIYESDTVVSTMSELIQKFPTETLPNSLQLTQGLFEILLSVENNYEDSDENTQIKMMDSVHVATDSICYLIEINKSNFNATEKFANTFIPYILKQVQITTDFQNESFDNTVTLALALAKALPTPYCVQMQQLFSMLLSLTPNMNYSTLSSTETLISKMISRCPELILVPTNMENLVILTKKFLLSEDMEVEIMSVYNTIRVALQKNPGKMDQFIVFLIDIVIPLVQKKNPAFFLQQVEAILDCIVSNPAFTLAVLNQRGFLNDLFQLWNGMIANKLPSLMDKKLSILAMLSILTIPINNMPQIVSQSLTNFYETIVQVVVAAQSQRKKTQAYYEEQRKNGGTSILNKMEDVGEDEDILYDDEVNDEDVKAAMEQYLNGGIDLDEDILDDEEENDDDDLVIDERNAFYVVMRRILEGDLKDQRHVVAIQGLTTVAREEFAKIFVEQAPSK
ncbi:importin beta SMX1, putative [Entamoeba invadens IP1]|uniref:Importin beta SMX1, putative n=1 Tax=Entamoeba invadens IP1 TaxID=370355 RepID=A0A0A1UDN6_ENTIV|nr:importin beta SMX1, putative [Entamoeba invadens IP1]ELP90859.1 importin beta SMX1, putative [Entamoeba invadens IP1]|eukprot:XP_004257630.1 importin beta SMX1, putative [Entamoeba invadens IP1]